MFKPKNLIRKKEKIRKNNPKMRIAKKFSQICPNQKLQAQLSVMKYTGDSKHCQNPKRQITNRKSKKTIKEVSQKMFEGL